MYIVEDIKSEDFKKFIYDFPLPKYITKLDEKYKIIELRKWVHNILPELENNNINSFEPESPYEILIKNKNKKTFSKICSADAKFFQAI